MLIHPDLVTGADLVTRADLGVAGPERAAPLATLRYSGRIIGREGACGPRSPVTRRMGMDQAWTYADLAPEQVALVDEAERTLDTDIVMVYRPTRFGTVDEDLLAAEGLHPVELDPVQLECLLGLERMVGGVVVAYRRDLD